MPSISSRASYSRRSGRWLSRSSGCGTPSRRANTSCRQGEWLMLEQPSPTVHRVPSVLRGRLFRKYVVIFVALVSGALLTSGLVESYFVYTENQAVVIRLQRERAEA